MRRAIPFGASIPAPVAYLAIVGAGAVLALHQHDWAPFLAAGSLTLVLALRLLERPLLTATVVISYAVLLTDGPLAMWIAVPAVALVLAWAPVARGLRYRFGWPVLMGCVGVPVLWAIVGVAHGNRLAYVAGNAEHFLLFGLYFPIRWASTRSRHFLVGAWLTPTFVLCCVTVVLWLGFAALHFRYGINSPIFQTALARQDPANGYRVFSKGDVFLIPAGAFLWLRLLGRIQLRDLTGLVLVLVSAIVTGTRGLWLAIAASVVWAGFARSSRAWGRSLVLVLVVGAILLATPALPYIQQRLGGFFGPSHDISTQIHITESNELLAAFRHNPVIGTGLGAVLPSGFVRAPDTPYLYELTFHQMLFQMGIIGSILFLAPIGLALFKGVRLTLTRESQRESSASQLAQLGCASLVGLLVVSATNPYLFAAVGAVLVALSLAMIDAAADLSTATTDPKASLNSGAATSA